MIITLRKLLFVPFSWLYGAGIYLRNRLYDMQIKKSVSFELPVIGIGNISAGGTGKTPHIEYLIRLLKNNYQIGVLSRGYGRKSTGYLLVEESSSVDQTGDESLQVKRKFQTVMVAVCEERAIGIPIMLLDNPLLQVILLDDAFQHRQVNPGLSFLLTEYSKPFYNDSLLPAGRLREPPGSAKRADAIVVTKCNQKITAEEKKQLTEKLARGPDQPVFFSYLEYGTAYSFFHPDRKLNFSKNDMVLLFCGIADPSALIDHLSKQVNEVKLMRFRDHHRYSLSGIKEIFGNFSRIKEKRKFLVTTEKDAVRLLLYKDYLINQQVEIYCVPVEVEFFEADKGAFDKMVFDFVSRIHDERIQIGDTSN